MQRKRKSTDARLAEIEAKKNQYQAKIETYKAKISDLDAKVQQIRDRQKQNELEDLLKVIKASGKTPEEVIATLKPAK